MGYRSDVVITLLKKDVDNAPASIKEFLGTPEKEIDGYVLFLFEDYGWYESYQDIQEIESFIENKYHTFLRIGEDWNDNEERINLDPVRNSNVDYDDPFNVRVHRSIEWD